jgi:Flp pilus assembly protein TadD
MAIRGSLHEASLPDVFQLLAMGKKTGCLGVTQRNQFGSIYFERGRIVYAAIVNRRDRLGDILVSAGIVTRTELEAAIGVQRAAPHRRLGDILVAQGLIARDELHAYVRMQIEEAVYVLFTWSHGTFNFEVDVRPEEQDFIVSINVESLLLEGARRVDEWSLIQQKIASFDLIFALDQDKIRARGVVLTMQQEIVAGLIDGRRDVAAVIDASGLSEFDVGKALYALASGGLLLRVGRTQGRTPVVADARVEEHRNLGIAFYKTGMLDEAEREFHRVAELRPDDVGPMFYLGLVSIRRGDWAAAVTALQSAVAIPGAGPAAAHNLAYALERLGRDAEAEAALSEAVARGGGSDPHVLTSRAALALRRRDLETATRDLAAARPLWGRKTPSPAWYHYAAVAAILSGDLDRATALLTEGIAQHPRAVALHGNLAAVQERQGHLSEAVATWERALELEPENATFQRQLDAARHVPAGPGDDA